MAPRELHGQGFFGTYTDAVLPGTHVIEGGQTSTGSVLAWFRWAWAPCGGPDGEEGAADLQMGMGGPAEAQEEGAG